MAVVLFQSIGTFFLMCILAFWLFFWLPLLLETMLLISI